MKFALLVSEELTIKTHMKDTEEACLEGESQEQPRLGPSRFYQMELAFPWDRINQAIQGNISQWGNHFQMTPCVVGSTVWRLLLGTHADDPPSEQSENLLVPQGPDLSC